MAIIDKNALKGLFGSVVAREVRGRQVMSGKPEKVKQTAHTKNAALDFGRASYYAQQICIAFFPLIRFYNDSYMVGRLAGEISSLLSANHTQPPGQRELEYSNVRRLVGFDFNKHSPLQKSLMVDVSVSLDPQRQLAIHLPAFNWKAAIRGPKRSSKYTNTIYYTHCIIRLRACALDFESADHDLLLDEKIEIDLTPKRTEVAERLWEIDVNQLPDRRVIFVAMSLEFHFLLAGEYYIVNSREFHPAGIVGGLIT